MMHVAPRRYRFVSFRLAVLLAGCVAVAAHAEPLDLATIMAEPDWIGQPVQAPYWSADGRSLYYRLKRDGSTVTDLYRVDPAGGRSQRLDAAASIDADGPAVFDRERRRAAFFQNGYVYVKDLAGGRRVQVTHVPQADAPLQFSADGRALQYRQGQDWYRYDLAAAVSAPVAVLKFAKDPRDAAPDALAERQTALFSTLRADAADRAARQEADQALAAADPERAPPTFWLGEERVALDSALSPDGCWLLVVVAPKAAGRVPQLTRYVTASGYPEQENVHRYVGRDAPSAQSLLLLDVRERSVHAVSFDDLPGIHDDPLQAIRARTVAALQAAGKAEQAKALAAPAVRGVRIDTRGDYGGSFGIAWSEDGRNAAIRLQALDNKDRWIASVDFAKHRLVPQHRLSDEAWINWHFNDFGWHRDGRTLWYLSEESGYSQLYAKPLDGSARALTRGRFEVGRPQLSADGRWFYFRANREAPYSYDVYRVPASGGEIVRVSQYRGLDAFELSPDGSRLALLHSSPYVVPQLAVQPAAGGTPRELTDTMKPAFAAHAWIAPEIVQIPSSHGAGTIYAKYYGAATPAAARPAVIFLHGGDLQDAHLSYPAYFREQMFHNLLVQQGYAVLDIDYRVSTGYGRAWRTAVYRQLGHAELDDILDGKAWLVQQRGVDAKRVGVYGGSMGGFNTLMALLRAPGEFAAGAALRPVADWTLYDQGISAAILNDPQLDPEAYRVSSPIDYADRLQDALLISHGLIDDNVFAADSIRLYQRFVELRKKDFWLTLYPLERHGFVHADAWYDQYRRIEALFRNYLKP
jgi:dipeptidyl aminopeptidase/acylaminoacyl peptidase